MILRLFAVAAALLGTARSQKSKVHGQVGAENATTPTAREGDHTIHFVTVGKAENNFYPNSIVAQPGDVVSFQFYPLNHSVIKSAYGYPCVPYNDIVQGGDLFTSGFMPVAEVQSNPPTWNLTINDTQPVFYYCGAPGSCIDWGMVGVINANASTSISTQIALARQADFQLTPGEPFPNEAQQASMESLAATATTATLTVTATPPPKTTSQSSSSAGNYDDYHHNDGGSSGLSTGAIAGIAVGAAIAGIAAAALFFLMCRTRSLKKQLDQQRAAPQPPPPTWYDQSRHASTLPPYQGSERDTLKPAGAEGFGSDRSQSPQLTTYPMQSQQFAPPQHSPPMDRRYTQFTSTSELGGPRYPPVELGTGATSPHEQMEYYR